jgi:hypothetical protein
MWALVWILLGGFMKKKAAAGPFGVVVILDGRPSDGVVDSLVVS